MTTLSPHQVADAVAILNGIDTEARRVANLNGLIAAARTMADISARAHSDALNYPQNPNQLADLIPLLRRNARPDVSHAIVRYHNFLADLRHPLVPSRPQSIDMNALTPEARPYLLGPYLGLIIGDAYPRLCVDRSDPSRGTLVYLTTGGPAAPSLWISHLPKVSQWLGGHWSLTAHTATSITLTRRPPLPTNIPFHRQFLRPGHLFLGINVDVQRPHHVPFVDLSHVLITGTVGMGKSVALASIMQSLIVSLDTIHHVFCVDPGGIAFGRYRNMSRKITTISKADDFTSLASALVTLMDKREAELGAAGREKFSRNWVFVIVDEWPAYGTPEGTDKASKEVHALFMKNILALAKRGRKSAIRLVLTTQVPSEQDIWPALRAALPGVLAFRTPLIAHANSLFGELGALPADPRTLARGRALYRDGVTGDLVHLQFPLITAGSA